MYKNHAYIVFDFAGEHGRQVFDLRLLRGTSAYRNYSPTYTYDKVHSVHNLAINEETGFAFATGMSSGGQNCGSGLHMVDLSSPAKREFAGCFSYEPEVGNDAPGMYGSWSNYPFFASGIIAVTSMDGASSYCFPRSCARISIAPYPTYTSTRSSHAQRKVRSSFELSGSSPIRVAS